MRAKYFFIFIFLSLVFSFRESNAQGLTIGSSTVFSLGSSVLSLSNNWNNAGTFTAGLGSVIFNGPAGNQTITNEAGETFYNLILNKTDGDVQLLNNITINGMLILTGGDIDMNGLTLTMGSSSILSEAAGSTVKGSGSLTTTRNLNAPSSVNLLGIEITSSANLGSTVISRGHSAQAGGGNNSILRHFNIIPANNSGLDASIVLHYDDSELNSLTEAELIPFRSEDGTNWTLVSGSSINTTTNTVSFSGLSSLSRFTVAASSAPLPLELVSFSAQMAGNGIMLNWRTSSESGTYGFDIERNVQSAGHGRYEKIGFVKGAGNSNSLIEYSFCDNLSDLLNIPLCNLRYRLKQIDIDGNFKYSDAAEIKFTNLPENFEVFQNYPNPFNPTTTIKYSIPAAQFVMLKVYNILGKDIATLINEQQEAGNYEIKFDGSELASGIYLFKLQTNDFTITKKMVLAK